MADYILIQHNEVWAKVRAATADEAMEMLDRLYPAWRLLNLPLYVEVRNTR